jgi:hypothetical protein
MKKETQQSCTEHESGLVKAFFLPQRQERYLELLAKPKRRTDIIREFAHFKHLDPRWVVRIAPSSRRPGSVYEILRERGALEICYGFSEWSEIDGKTLPLLDALRTVIGSGMGTFLSCLPGRLAYFEDEDMRCILERNATRGNPK